MNTVLGIGDLMNKMNIGNRQGRNYDYIIGSSLKLSYLSCNHSQKGVSSIYSFLEICRFRAFLFEFFIKVFVPGEKQKNEASLNHKIRIFMNIFFEKNNISVNKGVEEYRRRTSHYGTFLGVPEMFFLAFIHSHTYGDVCMYVQVFEEFFLFSVNIIALSNLKQARNPGISFDWEPWQL